jgi:hypothetical protein
VMVCGLLEKAVDISRVIRRDVTLASLYKGFAQRIISIAVDV